MLGYDSYDISGILICKFSQSQEMLVASTLRRCILGARKLVRPEAYLAQLLLAQLALTVLWLFYGGEGRN